MDYQIFLKAPREISPVGHGFVLGLEGFLPPLGPLPEHSPSFPRGDDVDAVLPLRFELAHSSDDLGSLGFGKSHDLGP